MEEEKADIIPVSFRTYYEENISALIIFARRFVSDEMAEDITQDLFLEIWDKYLSEDKLPSRSYLFSAIRNKCLNVLTREQVKRNYVETVELEVKLLGLDYYSSHDKLLIDKESRQYIYDQIEKLPKKCRETFKMSYLEEMKNAEIAEKLNISIRTVEHHLYLGLKTLRERMTRNGKKDLFFLFFF